MYSIVDLLKFIFIRILWKGIKDITLTLYDDFEFNCMSLIRVAFAVAIICTLVAWISQQFHGYKFDDFSELVKLDIALAALYGVKKWTGRNNNDGQNSN